MSAEGANQTNSDLDYLRCEDGVSWLWHFLVNLRKKEKEVFVEFFIQFVLSVCLYDIGLTSTLQRIETVWKLTLRADMGVTYSHFWNPKDLQSLRRCTNTSKSSKNTQICTYSLSHFPTPSSHFGIFLCYFTHPKNPRSFFFVFHSVFFFRKILMPCSSLLSLFVFSWLDNFMYRSRVLLSSWYCLAFFPHLFDDIGNDSALALFSS